MPINACYVLCKVFERVSQFSTIMVVDRDKSSKCSSPRFFLGKKLGRLVVKSLRTLLAMQMFRQPAVIACSYLVK